MIAALTASPIIAFLGGGNLGERVIERLSLTIADADMSGASATAQRIDNIIGRALPFDGLSLGDIGAKPNEAAAFCPHDPFGDHKWLTIPRSLACVLSISRSRRRTSNPLAPTLGRSVSQSLSNPPSRP